MPRAKKQHLKKRADGRYACRYKDHFFYGATEDEALAQRAAFVAAETAGNQNVLVSPLLKDYTATWFPVAFGALSDGSIKMYAHHLNVIVSEYGNSRLSDITPTMIKALYTAHYDGLSRHYIGKAQHVFTRLFDAAVSDGYLESNPATTRAAKPHVGTDGGYRAITDEERVWMHTLCTDHPCYAPAMLMLYAGLRPQEMKAFDVDESVDFDRGVVRVLRFVHVRGANEYYVSNVGKTRRAVREIPLFSPLRAALKGRHGLIVSRPDGSLVTPDYWRKLWDKYTTAMNTAINGCRREWYGKTLAHRSILSSGGELPPWREFTVVPYDLRHSFCTMCRDRGVEMHTCMRWMGHANADMILHVYDEVSASRVANEAIKIESAFRSQFGSQSS